MTEFDNFINSLKKKYRRIDTSFAREFNVQNDSEGLFYNFRKKKKMVIAFAKHQPPKRALDQYKRERSVFCKKYGFTLNENQILQQIVYVRYINRFLIGIIGPKNFASKIVSNLESFIKSDLHLRFREVSLISCDKGAVEFLGFNIYLSLAKKNIQAKPTELKSLVKYKKRSIACLKRNDARISQAYFNSIKQGFLNYLQNVYEELDLKKNKSTDLLLVKNFVNKNLGELLIFNSQKNVNRLSPNLALRRFTQHFKDLFSRNLNISLKA